jgi:hypothetical protein
MVTARIALLLVALVHAACLVSPPRPMSCRVVSSTLERTLEAGLQPHGPVPVNFVGCSWIAMPGNAPEAFAVCKADRSNPMLQLGFVADDEPGTNFTPLLQMVPDGAPHGFDVTPYPGCIPKAGAGVSWADNAIGEVTGHVDVAGSAWPDAVTGDAEVPLTLIFDLVVTNASAGSRRTYTGEVKVALTPAVLSGAAPRTECEGPDAKTVDNRYLCLGEGEYCLGQTLPCCTDECEDHLRRPHPAGVALECAIDPLRPLARACKRRSTPDDTTPPDDPKESDPCGMKGIWRITCASSPACGTCAAAPAGSPRTIELPHRGQDPAVAYEVRNEASGSVFVSRWDPSTCTMTDTSTMVGCSAASSTYVNRTTYRDHTASYEGDVFCGRGSCTVCAGAASRAGCTFRYCGASSAGCD